MSSVSFAPLMSTALIAWEGWSYINKQDNDLLAAQRTFSFFQAEISLFQMLGVMNVSVNLWDLNPPNCTSGKCSSLYV